MDIALTIGKLVTHSQTIAAAKRLGFAYRILFLGILSGAGALVLAMMVNT